MNQTVTSYKLNTENAKQVGQPGRIQERGAYTGVFTRAEAIVSREGTQGIEFAFKSDDGQTADYLTLYTINKDGKEIYGRKVLDAIMTCMKVRDISAQRATVQKYDHTAGREVPCDALIFSSLMNKPIGLMMVREEYEKNDGTTGWKMTIVSPYEASTHKMAREVLEQKPAESFEKILVTLADRPLKRKSTVPSASGRRHDPDQTTGTGFDDMDDDIPF